LHGPLEVEVVAEGESLGATGLGEADGDSAGNACSSVTPVVEQPEIKITDSKRADIAAGDLNFDVFIISIFYPTYGHSVT
jgi:hypothetical protein